MTTNPTATAIAEAVAKAHRYTPLQRRVLLGLAAVPTCTAADLADGLGDRHSRASVEQLLRRLCRNGLACQTHDQHWHLAPGGRYLLASSSDYAITAEQEAAACGR